MAAWVFAIFKSRDGIVMLTLILYIKYIDNTYLWLGLILSYNHLLIYVLSFYFVKLYLSFNNDLYLNKSLVPRRIVALCGIPIKYWDRSGI